MARTKAAPKEPVAIEDTSAPTLEYKEPRSGFGDRGRFPYQQAGEMLGDQPGRWLSLRTGPSSRMDQFRLRFIKKMDIPDGWKLEMRSEKVEGQDGILYKDSVLEVFARLVEAD